MFVTLWVPSMAQFAAVNAVYSVILPAVNPPARACVEIPGNTRCKLAVEAVFARQSGPRRVLHVQVHILLLPKEQSSNRTFDVCSSPHLCFSFLPTHVPTEHQSLGTKLHWPLQPVCAACRPAVDGGADRSVPINHAAR